LLLCANLIAALGFVVFGPVQWLAALPLAAGFFVGGLIAPVVVRRLPEAGLRIAIGVAGLALALKLGLDAYGAA
ncbi:MAG TPA: TSUP family transporter, partial [Actinomycetales bacterium]|nr:TSUP family transporter [Actinomycetales bacterium]